MTAEGKASTDSLLSKTFQPRDTEARLRKKLERFTDPEKAQIKQTGAPDAANAFLNIAAAEAKTVFDDPRPAPVVDDSINRNNNTGTPVPNLGGGARTGLDGASRQYTLDDLYKSGAMVADVSGPGDPHSRRISMKIYTKRSLELERLTLALAARLFDRIPGHTC